MKVLCVIALFISFAAGGQENQIDEREKIYQHILRTHIDKKDDVLDEIFTPVNKYDIDGNYQRWFYRSGMMVSVVPIQYESTVYDFLQSKNINLDTLTIFRQIDTAKLDSLSKYTTIVNIISINKAPLRHSFLGNLFKKKSAVGLSQIYFDKGSRIAFVKLQVYSKKKQSIYNPSKIIILQRQDEEWKTIGVLQKTLQPTAVLH
jgi:hypothetical protein